VFFRSGLVGSGFRQFAPHSLGRRASYSKSGTSTVGADVAE
jgi:hypothetical protein